MRKIDYSTLGTEPCQALNPMDSLHFGLQKPGLPQVIATTITVDTSRSPHPVTADSWREHLARRCMQLPFLYRVYEPKFGSRGVWRHVDNLDIDYHFPAVTHEAAVDRESSIEFMRTRFKKELDYKRPPWEFASLLSPDGSRVTTTLRLHHSLVDGMFAFTGLRIIFDESPEVYDIGQPLEVPESVQKAAAIDARQFKKLQRQRGREAKLVALRDLKGLVAETRAVAVQHKEILQDKDPALVAPRTGGRTSWGRTRASGKLAVHWGQVESGRIRHLKSSLSVGYNELVMAGYTGALKAKLHREGIVPDRPLICGVPVSTRTAKTLTASGNHTGSYNLPLPVHLDDPVERAQFLKEATRLATKLYHCGSPRMQERVGRFIPLRSTSRLMSAYAALNLARFHPQVFDTFATVLPLPSENLHVFGSPVVDVFSTSALSELCHCEFVAIRGRELLRFSFAADPVSFGDSEEIAADIAKEFAALERAASSKAAGATP